MLVVFVVVYNLLIWFMNIYTHIYIYNYNHNVFFMLSVETST
jgi:hypothetical protein